MHKYYSLQMAYTPQTELNHLYKSLSALDNFYTFLDLNSTESQL